MLFGFTLCVIVIVFVDKFEGVNICKVPNGDAGTCIEISQCKPLWDIYKKRPKTKEENQYINQAYCGNPASPKKFKVCCPDESIWSSFIVNPVVYEKPDNSIEQGPAPVITKYKPDPPTVEPVVVPLSANTESSVKKGTRGPTVAFKNQNGCGAYATSASKIQGGEPTSIDQYPWLVLFEYSGGILGCGGSLITSRFVMTAAHCIRSSNGAPQIARLAEYNITSYPIDYVEVEGGGFDQIENIFVPIENAFPHPEFNRKTLLHDIGIVKLAEEAVFSDFIKVVCLPTKDYIPELPQNANFTVAGWGDESVKTEFFDVKKEVILPYVPLSKCQQTGTMTLIDSQICAGGEEGKDSCKGDSGGPLMYDTSREFVIVGVVSYGPRDCGTRGRPAVYTHVFKYLDWITETIQVL